MKINYVIGAFLCVLGCYGCSSPKTEVKSPDGHIKMALTVDDNGKPLYNILVGDSLLIEIRHWDLQRKTVSTWAKDFR